MESFRISDAMECRVEYDYDAQEPDELTIKKGEIIKNVVAKMDGWFEGTLKGRTGVFPDNFVKFIEKTNNEPKAGKGSEVVVLRNNPSSVRRVKVLFSYAPEQDDELALDVGDILEFIEEVEEGWWRGKLKGKEGIFPSNFVQEVEDVKTNGNVDSVKPEDTTRQKEASRNSHSKGIPDVVPTSSPKQSNDDEPAPELPPKPVRELARCFYPYKALNEDELTLAEGDIITIISRTCEDEGWWRGELRGRIGLFPDNFVKIILPGEVQTGSSLSGTQPKQIAQERNVPQGVHQTEHSKANKDSISGASGTVVDGVGMSKEKGENGIPTKAKVEQAKAKLNKSNSKESHAPIAPKVGHPATSPISPNIAALHSNLFSNQIPPDAFARKEFPSTNMKDDKNSDESEEFNSVERTETLNHLTATRAKAPKRRPPSTIITRENDGSLVNGSSHSYENSMSDSPPPHQSTPINLSVTSNGTASGSFVTADGGSLNNSGSFLSQSRDKESSPTPTNAKTKKQTPPWMAELKQTQDKKRGLVSPVSTPTTATSGSVSNSSPSVTTTSPAQIPPQQPVQVLPSTPAKDSHAKAPPLPAKPSSFSNTVGQEKPVNNMNHSSSNNSTYSVSNKNFSKKSPSPAPPVPVVTSNITNSSGTENHRVEGDANSNKNYVSYEEYMALKLRVTSLENEVETLKRQLKMMIDRDLRGHIV